MTGRDSPRWASPAPPISRSRWGPCTRASSPVPRSPASPRRPTSWRGSARGAATPTSRTCWRPAWRFLPYRAGTPATRSRAGRVWPRRTPAGGSAAFRRDGLAGSGDTLQAFHVTAALGIRAAQLELRSNVPWLSAPPQMRAGAPATDVTVAYRAAALTAPGVYVGTVTARNPTDTLAGALFALVNTIAVPYDLTTRPLADQKRTVAAGRVQRYFLRVPAAGSTLRATVSLADSTQHAFVRLYEPDGQPFRDAPDDINVGGGDAGTADVVVRAEDLVAGVYELDVVAPPLATVTADVRAAIAPVTLARTGRGVEAGDVGPETTGGRVTTRLIGAEAAFPVAGRGLPAESLTVRVPAWAARAEVDVEMAREQWNRFTDFGVTVFDSSGQQVSEG